MKYTLVLTTIPHALSKRNFVQVRRRGSLHTVKRDRRTYRKQFRQAKAHGNYTLLTRTSRFKEGGCDEPTFYWFSLVSSLVRVCVYVHSSVVARSRGSYLRMPNGVYYYTYVCLTFTWYSQLAFDSIYNIKSTARGRVHQAASQTSDCVIQSRVQLSIPYRD